MVCQWSSIKVCMAYIMKSSNILSYSLSCEARMHDFQPEGVPRPTPCLRAQPICFFKARHSLKCNVSLCVAMDLRIAIFSQHQKH